ncbi:MAG: zf-HC2 domain-containing protein, partial [Deltaproteobacteria bacterium]
MFRRHVVSKLSEYLDGGFSEGARSRIERHLNECASCRQELERLAALSRKLKSWQVPELGPGFDDQVRSRIALREIQGEEEMNKTATGWLRPQLVPSGVIVSVLGFLIVGTLVTQVYMKRGYQGRIKAAGDELGSQYQPGKYNWELKTDQYEPEYNGPKMKGYSESTVRRMASLEAGGFAPSPRIPAQTLAAPDQGSVIVIQPTLPAVKDGEMVIRTALIDLEVIDGQKAYDTASKV